MTEFQSFGGSWPPAISPRHRERGTLGRGRRDLFIRALCGVQKCVRYWALDEPVQDFDPSCASSRRAGLTDLMQIMQCGSAAQNGRRELPVWAAETRPG